MTEWSTVQTNSSASVRKPSKHFACLFVSIREPSLEFGQLIFDPWKFNIVNLLSPLQVWTESPACRFYIQRLHCQMTRSQPQNWLAGPDRITSRCLAICGSARDAEGIKEGSKSQCKRLSLEFSFPGISGSIQLMLKVSHKLWYCCHLLTKQLLLEF